MATDLFGEVPRRPRVLRMHIIDAGTAENGDKIGRYQCGRCGAETDWLEITSISASKRGIPCETCNQPTQGGV
jgi:hypothetical protein